MSNNLDITARVGKVNANTSRFDLLYAQVELGSAANIGQGLLSQAVNNLQHKLSSGHNDRVHCTKCYMKK